MLPALMYSDYRINDGWDVDKHVMAPTSFYPPLLFFGSPRQSDDAPATAVDITGTSSEDAAVGRYGCVNQKDAYPGGAE